MILRARREGRGWSRQELRDRMKERGSAPSVGAIYAWEEKGRQPEARFVAVLSGIFDVGPETFFR